MDVVIVVGGQDFVACLQGQPVIDQRQSGGGVLCQGDVFGTAADVLGDGHGDVERNVVFGRFEHPALDGQEWVGVELSAIGLDGRSHRPWV